MYKFTKAKDGQESKKARKFENGRGTALRNLEMNLAKAGSPSSNDLNWERLERFSSSII